MRVLEQFVSLGSVHILVQQIAHLVDFAPDAELVGFSDREGGLGPAQRKASVTHPAWRQG